MTDERHPPDLFRVGDENMCVGELTLSSDCYPIYDDDGLIVGITFEKNDARRIVACVNACVGIPTEQLESGEARSVRDELADIATLEKQRDDLMNALEILTEVYDAMGAPRGPSRIIADAAIASVKGGAACQ